MTTSYGTYTDCAGIEREIDSYHMHELLDRVHVIGETFDTHVSDHPAASKFYAEIEEISQLIHKLYQKIGCSY